MEFIIYETKTNFGSSAKFPQPNQKFNKKSNKRAAVKVTLLLILPFVLNNNKQGVSCV